MAVETATDGPVLVITNADPASRNSIGPDDYAAIDKAVQGAAHTPDVGAVVITGAGKFFCSGGNINVLRRRLDMDEAGRRAGVDRLHAMARAIRECPVPVIAAVEGGAAGAGLALALACDLIVAAGEAYFAASYVRIGLTPDGGTTSYLGQALPRQLANEMLMTGDRLPAQRLFDAGLVNRLTEQGRAFDEAMAWAHELAGGPRRSLAAIKALAASGQTNDFNTQLDAEAGHMTEALGGAEGREGVTAFLAKRKPDFGNCR